MACGMFRWISVVFRNMVRLIFQIAVTSVIGSLASQSFPAAIVNFPAAFPNRSWDLQAVSRTSAATKRASYAASSGAAARSRSIPIIIAGDAWIAGPEPSGSLNTMLFPNGTLGEIWKDGYSWSSNRIKLALFSELSKSYLTPRVEPLVESGILHGENSRTSNALRACSPKEAVACDGDRKKNRDRSPQHLRRDLHRQPHVACNCGLLSMLRMLVCCMIVFEHAPAAFCEGSIVEDSFADSWEDVRNQLSGGVYSDIGGGWCFGSQFSSRTNGTGTSAVSWDAGIFSALQVRTGRSDCPASFGACVSRCTCPGSAGSGDSCSFGHRGRELGPPVAGQCLQRFWCQASDWCSGSSRRVPRRPRAGEREDAEASPDRRPGECGPRFAKAGWRDENRRSVDPQSSKRGELTPVGRSCQTGSGDPNAQSANRARAVAQSCDWCPSSGADARSPQHGVPARISAQPCRSQGKQSAVLRG